MWPLSPARSTVLGWSMAELARALDRAPTLPAEVTGFVGRRRERAEVRRLLSSSRLVTLTGFGGVGKTRLALRVAGDLSRIYPDGVWFVPFGELSDSDLVAEATAAALGIEDRAGHLDGRRLVDHLRGRELLLVFDNCEHLIDACADLADQLLRGCARLRILTTSREPLRVHGEVVMSLLPLSVPGPAETLGSVEAYESVELFADRVARVVPGFVVDEHNRSAVVDICRHLDGIPLALELAAFRLRAMAPADLLHELRRHWQVLDVGIRAAPDRHQTMTACLAWSHALCEPRERDLWERLSVFVGGMELDAVAYVMAQPPNPVPPDDLLRIVESMVAKSILVPEPVHDGMRYRMLEVIRLYGAGRLADRGLLPAMRTRQRDWCAELLARSELEWATPLQVEAMRRVRREEANMRAALRFCWQEPGQAAIGLQMAARLGKFMMAHGWPAEGRLWLNRLLAKVPEPGPERFGGLFAACWLAVLQGDQEVATPLLRECAELATHLEEVATPIAEELAGWHDMFGGELTTAAQHFRSASEGFAAAEWPGPHAETLMLLGMALDFAGDVEHAAEAHAACLQLCVDGANPSIRAYSLQWGGLVAAKQGDHDRARAWEREALRISRELEERLAVVLCLESLAWIECDTSPRRAATMLGAATAYFKSAGTTAQALPGLFAYHRDTEARLEATLSRLELNAALEKGSSMQLDAAIAFALDESQPTAPGPEATTGDPLSTAKLTRREREIAELVAEGLSNKDIATRLVISVRTVETHVEHVLVKLAFTSRAQIAAWLSKQAGA